MSRYPPRPGLIVDCLFSPGASSSVVTVLELLDLTDQRIWLRLSVALAAETPVFIRLTLPGGTEHVAPGEVLWSVRDPGKPDYFTAVRFTPPLADDVLRLFVDMP